MKFINKRKSILSLVISFLLVFSFISSVFADSTYYYTVGDSSNKLYISNTGTAKIYVYKNINLRAPIRIDRLSGSKTFIVTVYDPNGNYLYQSVQVTGSSWYGSLTGSGRFTVYVRNSDGTPVYHSLWSYYPDIQ